jgi:RHS repeat-associated protein
VEEDAETGMYYLRSRYYNPEWGRFLNADVLLGSKGALLSHNLFAYCVNHPIITKDPDGLRHEQSAGGGGGLSLGKARDEIRRWSSNQISTPASTATPMIISTPKAESIFKPTPTPQPTFAPTEFIGNLLPKYPFGIGEAAALKNLLKTIPEFYTIQYGKMAPGEEYDASAYGKFLDGTPATVYVKFRESRPFSLWGVTSMALQGAMQYAAAISGNSLADSVFNMNPSIFDSLGWPGSMTNSTIVVGEYVVVHH